MMVGSKRPGFLGGEFGQYDPERDQPQTETVELDADLMRRARREAERRGITLRQLVEDALRQWLAREGRESRSRTARPRLGVGRSTDGLSAAEVATEPVSRPFR